jgi:non-specific serine/threonine protein kinase
MSEQQGFERELGIAHYFLGLLELHELNEATAHQHLESSRRLLEFSDATLPYASVLSSLACYFSSDGEQARLLIRESLAILSTTQDVRATAIAHARLGRIEWLQGNTTAARESKRAALRLYRDIAARFGIAISLEELGWIAMSLDEPAVAAQLLGAAEAVRRELSAEIPANHMHHHRDALKRARAALGDARYRRLCEHGAGLTLAQAIVVALGEGGAEPPPDEQRDEWDLLSRRERQVAELVAHGASNPEIASTLLITRHTVKTHMQNIMAKLDCQSRIDIAVWVSRQPQSRAGDRDDHPARAPASP